MAETINDAPEFIKIHLYIFAQQDHEDQPSKTDTCQITLYSPSGQVLMKKKDSIGMVIQFYAEIKGEYMMEIKNLTSKRMRVQIA